MTTGVPLYLVSACGTAEEFVAAFRRYADRAGLFVPTSAPLPAGKRGRIAVTLSDGGVMIEGEAEILQSSAKPTVLQGRPGMTIKFVEPDEPSKLVIAELEKARLAMRPPPPTVPPRPATIPAEPRAIVPPVGGRIDAANALAESIVIGDPSTLRDTASARPAIGGAKPFAVPAIPSRPSAPSTPPRDKPATVPPPIPAYPTNTKLTSIGFPAIDKLPATGPTPAPAAPTGHTGRVTAPASTGNTGKVTSPASTGNTGKVTAPASTGNTGTVTSPASTGNTGTVTSPTGNTGKVTAPASTGNTGTVTSPASTGNTGKVTAPASTGNTGKVSNATTLGMPALDRKPDPALLNTTPGTAAPPNPTQQMRAENPLLQTRMGVGVATDSEATSIGEKPPAKPVVAADDEATAVGVVVNKVRPASDDEATSIGEMPPKAPASAPAQKMGKLTMGWDTVAEPAADAAPSAPAPTSKSGSVSAPASAPATPQPPKPPATPPSYAAAKNHRATSIGFPAMRTPFETQQVGVVPPPKESDPSAPVVAKKQGMPQQPRGKTPTAPPPGPRYPTPAAPLPVVLMPVKTPAVADEEEKTDLSSIPIAQLEAKAVAAADEIPETPVPQFDPLEKAAPTTGRSGGMRASEIMAAIGGDDWTMTPDASAPTVLEKGASPVEATPASTPGSGPVAKGPPTGNWTISLDPETGWSEPEKVAAPVVPAAPAPAPKAKRGAGNPSVAIAGKEAINVVEWEEKPTGIGEAKIEIDATLMEPAKIMPIDESDSGASVMTQEYQPPPLPMPPATPTHSFPASTMMSPHGSGMMPPAGMPQASSQFPTPAPGMFEVGAAPGAAPSKKRWMFIAGSAAVVVVIAVIAVLATGGGNKKAKPTGGSNTAPIAHPVIPADAAVTPEPAMGSGSAGQHIVETGSATTEPPTPPPVATGGPCKVAVSSVPTGADVLLGKQKLGTTPSSFELPCGTESTLTLKKSRYVATSRSITPSAAKTNKLTVKLGKVMFSIKVTSTPAGATITVGGKSAGVTPATVRVAGYEASTITVSKSGFASDTSKVTAKANGQAHHVTLKRATRR